MTVQLRPAMVGDAELLFDWVNRPDSLAGKRQTKGAIDWETHKAWLAGLLQCREACLWIVEVDGHAAGQIRLSPDVGGRRLVDIYIDTVSRRSGVALTALRLALAQADLQWPGEPVYAEVLHGNAPSHGLFLRQGFRAMSQDDLAITYEFNPQGANG